MKKEHSDRSSRGAWIRIGCAAVILIAALLLWQVRQSRAKSDYEIEIVPPTCTENGYSLYRSRTTGETTVSDIVDATGHSFDDWDTVRVSDGITSTISLRRCGTCGLEEKRTEYPQLPIARLALTGSLDGIGKKDEVNVTAEFADGEQNIFFDCFATLKYQGHSSLIYPKKNFTLKFYKDEERQEKYKMVFSHWNKENKYILKANYIDPSHCRNLVCADIWADLCADRDNLPGELTGLSNYGAVDGFPLALYINDEFHGLYTMNLHKDDDLFGMEEGQRHAIMISNDIALPEAYFRAPAQFTDGSPWEVEYCGTEDAGWAQDSLNKLIRFVMTADDAAFTSQLEQYLDVDSAIDYLIAMYALGLTYSGTQDFILVSYGGPWIASLYDMEDAFGLFRDGTGAFAPDEYLPERSAEGWNSATGSLLWDRLLDCYETRICRRYQQLRQTVLSTDSLRTRVEEFMDGIPAELYEAERRQNPGIPSPFDQRTQIIGYITRRLQLLDEIFA